MKLQNLYAREKSCQGFYTFLKYSLLARSEPFWTSSDILNTYSWRAVGLAMFSEEMLHSRTLQTLFFEVMLRRSTLDHCRMLLPLIPRVDRFSKQNLITFWSLWELRWLRHNSVWQSLLGCFVWVIILQKHAASTGLEKYVLKMPLDAQIGSLGAENEHFKVLSKMCKILDTASHGAARFCKSIYQKSILNKNETICWLRDLGTNLL